MAKDDYRAAGDEARALTKQLKQIKTVRLAAGSSTGHPEARIRFFCNRFAMWHGEQWGQLRTVVEEELAGIPSCPRCKELAVTDDVIDFAEFKEHCTTQAKALGKSESKARAGARRTGYKRGYGS